MRLKDQPVLHIQNADSLIWRHLSKIEAHLMQSLLESELSPSLRFPPTLQVPRSLILLIDKTRTGGVRLVLTVSA